MSWFFGKKKHHRESPPDTPEEANTSGGQSDGYVIVEKEENVGSPVSESSGSLYPSLGPSPYPPTLPHHHQQQQNQCVDSQSYISGIPFKLSKSISADVEIDRLKIDEITSFVHRIKCEDYDYEFSLERSVINEMASGFE